MDRLHKPTLQAILAITSLSSLLNLISILTPWIMFSASTPSQRIFNQLIPGSENSGYLYLYHSMSCINKEQVSTPLEIKKACSLVMIGDLPDILKYINQASLTAIILMCLSLPVNLLSAYSVYLRTYDKDIGLPFLKYRYIVTILQGVVLVFSLVSFSTYVGLMNAKFTDTDAILLGFTGTQNRKWNYGGGMALSIITFILSILGEILMYIANNQRSIPLPPQPPVIPNPVATRNLAYS